LTLLLVLGLARLRQDRSVTGLLLSGVVLGALLSAGLTLALSAAGQDSGRILRWLLGSLAGASLPSALLVGAVAAISVALLLPFGRALNAYAVDAGLAQRLGVPTTSLQWAVLGAGSLAVGVSVGAVGIVGFVGLVTPHLVRGLVGSDVRPLLVGSALLGPVVVLAADLAAQRLLPVGELPLGAMTALIAAPMLLVILQRSLRDAA
jgi:iron complex transport system permease protein